MLRVSRHSSPYFDAKAVHLIHIINMGFKQHMSDKIRWSRIFHEYACWAYTHTHACIYIGLWHKHISSPFYCTMSTYRTLCHFPGSDIFTKHWRGFQHCASFKVAVSRDIFAFFISLFQPIWAQNKHAKTGFLKNSFSRRYFKFDEKFDSAEANTAQSRISFLQASLLKSQ